MNHSLSQQEIIAEWKLIEAARIDPAHFAPIYEKYFQRVFLFVFRRIEDEAISADLTSEVFLKALLNLNRVRYQGMPYKAWLYRIASNEVAGFFRNQSKVRIVNFEKQGLEQLSAETEKETSGLEHSLGKLTHVLAQLDEQDLQLVEMRYFEKIPFNEISFILGMTETNAKVRLHRLLKRLGKWMQEVGGMSDE